MALIVKKPWTSQPQVAALPAPEFWSATTLATHNFTNTGTTMDAKPSGIVHTSNGSSTYLSRSVAIRAGQPLFIAAYFRRNGVAAAGATLYSLGENAATGSFLGLRAGSTGGSGAISIFYRATAAGSGFEVGSNSSAIIPADTDTCVVGVVPSYSSAAAYVYVNGVKYNAVLSAGTPSGTALLAFEAVGANRRDTVGAYYPGDFYAVGYGGAISEERAKYISLNPWAMFAPLQRTLWTGDSVVVTIGRPGSDITTTGWTGVPDNTDKYTNIDEASASDTDYIFSPPVTGTVAPIIFGIEDQTGAINTLPVGTWDVNVRSRFSEGLTASQIRVTLLDSGGTSVGASSWQTVTASFADYVLSITTTGIAARIKIEAQ